MPSGIDTVCVVISDSELKNKKIVMRNKSFMYPDSIIVHPKMAIIATVGRGMDK